MQTKVWLLAFLLVACVPRLHNTKKDSSLNIPDEFPEQQKTEEVSIQSWREFYQDPDLSSLIETGLKNNQELQIVKQEIDIANNEVMARGGEILPKLGFETGYGIDKVGEWTSQGKSDAANNVPSLLQTPQLGLVANWEIDIWGKLRNATKSAYFDYLSSIEVRKFLVTRIVSEISHTYFELMALDNQLELINSYVEVLKKIKDMSSFQQNAGRSTSLPVSRFAAEVLKNEARQLQLQQQIIITQNKLNTLLGRFPQDLKRDSKQLLSMELSKVEAGIPSKLLDNRPDIKAAAFELEASKLNVSSVKARFYPSLNIAAAVGFESFNWAHFFNVPASLFYGITGNLSAPLLNRQAIKAAYFSANNRQIQAVYHYEQTLVTAYAEVVNQLNAIKNLNQIYELKSKQVATLNTSIAISNTLFMAARVDYIEALLTRRDALEAQIELIETKKQLLGAHINLYRALGGGWKGENA